MSGPAASPCPVVAHVVLGLRVGGLERMVTDLARRLQSTPYRGIVVCLDTGGPLQSELEAAGVPVVVIGKRPGTSLPAILTLARLLRAHRVRIVHTQNPGPHFHGMLAAVLARVPVRVHSKQGSCRFDSRLRLLRTRAMSWITDRMVAVSDTTLDEMLRIEGVSPRKALRIWNGIDTVLHRPPARQNVNPERPVIGTVARLSPEKDQATLLEGFRLVVDELPDAELVIAGDGSLAGALRERTARLALTHRVRFLGSRADVADLLRTLTLFTLTSTAEGLPLAIAEAMATGLPVVATDAGGCREAVNPPECGLIVPPGRPSELASALLSVLRDPAAAARMGAAARTRAVRYFSLESMTDAYTALYAELLRERAAGPVSGAPVSG